MRTTHRTRIVALICLAASAAAAQTATARIVIAANRFVSTLDDKQRQRVLFAFNDETQRARWSNLPVRMVPRAGLSMGELNPSQRSAALALVSSALSSRGFQKVQEIMDADEVLKHNEQVTHVILGINGYFVPDTGPVAFACSPVTHCRIARGRGALVRRTGRWRPLRRFRHFSPPSKPKC